MSVKHKFYMKFLCAILKQNIAFIKNQALFLKYKSNYCVNSKMDSLGNCVYDSMLSQTSPKIKKVKFTFHDFGTMVEKIRKK